jgi:hypothetical protein
MHHIGRTVVRPYGSLSPLGGGAGLGMGGQIEL